MCVVEFELILAYLPLNHNDVLLPYPKPDTTVLQFVLGYEGPNGPWQLKVRGHFCMAWANANQSQKITSHENM